MTSRLWLLLVAGLVSACTQQTGDTGLPSDPEGTETNQEVQLGVAVPRGEALAVQQMEDSLGAEAGVDVSFDVVRLFYRWDSVLPDPNLDALADRRVHLSVRPRTDAGEPILWRDLAAVEPGDVLYDQLVRWIDAAIELGPGTAFTINHEPETSDSAANGGAEDFKAMWRRVAEVVDERGGQDLDLVWTMTGGAFSDSRAEQWYPGDDVVDVVGADLYNWHLCQGSERPWRELSDLLAPPLAFAQAHGKPLALPEVGSTEDQADPSRKGQWFVNAIDTLAAEADNLDFIIYFNVTAPDGSWPNCVWDYDTSVASAEGFAVLAAEHASDTDS